MATEVPGLVISIEAGQDLSSDQYKVVVIASDGQVDVAGGAQTAIPVGVLQNKPSAAGSAATVMVSGVTKAIAGNTIASGGLVSPSAVVAGRLDAADAATDVIMGMALVGGAVGDIITVLLFGGPGGEIV